MSEKIPIVQAPPLMPSWPLSLSPRIIEQISAVKANKIFVDDNDESIIFNNVSALLESVPRQIRKRRPISTITDASRPPSRQQTTFPMDLHSDFMSMLSDPMPRSRQRISVPTHKDARKICKLRELFSDSDKRDHIDNMDCNALDKTRPSSCSARISTCDIPSGQGNTINKSVLTRPTTRRKVNALYLDDCLASQTEFGDRQALSDHNSVEGKYKNAWINMTCLKTCTTDLVEPRATRV